eukprot:Hpha_TRINITY_DN24364_c0_g1::TRINITY_DN24364_c0_g1_i1::g.147960::m.147960
MAGGNLNDDVAGDTPLGLAAGLGYVDVVEGLIKMGAEVDRSGAVRKACCNGHGCVVKVLHSNGGSLDLADEVGDTPCHYAAVDTEEVHTLKTLISLGANFDTPNLSGRTPFWVAARMAKKEAALVLAEAGAEVNRADNNGVTPAVAAAESGDANALLATIGAGVDPNQTDPSGVPLCVLVARAVQLSRAANDSEDEDYYYEEDDSSSTKVLRGEIARLLDILRLLVQKGGRGVKDCLQRPNLPWPVLSILYEACDDMTVRTEDGNTLLHHVAKEWGEAWWVIDAWKDQDGDINAVNEDGETPCHIAAAAGNADLVGALLQCGAHGSGTRKDGETPLTLALARGWGKVAAVLLSSERAVGDFVRFLEIRRP